MRWLILPFLLVTDVGCTKLPHLIEPAAVDDLHYAARSCRKLTAELKETYIELAERVNVQYDLAEGSGQQNANRISVLKGQQNTILFTMARKKCPPAQQTPT